MKAKREDLELYKLVKSGFILRNEQIYYICSRIGIKLHFPVINGKIVGNSDKTLIFPNEQVEIIPQEKMFHYDMNIEKDDDPDDLRFWKSPS
jgi:hypothetical protein